MSVAFVTGGNGFLGSHLIERLVARGDEVRALSRSERSDTRLRKLGATPVRGDLSDTDKLHEAMEDVGIVYHVAARTGGGTRAEFWSDNVTGTKNVLQAARRSSVRRLVHVGTEAALMAGQPLVHVDESAPLRPDSKAAYSASKAVAEQLVREANGPELETVILRPRFVWGPGDTSVLPGIIDKVHNGQFAWIGGGHHLTDTTHVENAVEGLLRVADRGQAGEAYFVTDGSPVEFRAFVTELVATQGVTISNRSLPYWLARLAAAASETTWKLLKLKGAPPLDYLNVWIAGQECTIDTTKAIRDLGYAPVISREDGLRALRRKS